MCNTRRDLCVFEYCCIRVGGFVHPNANLSNGLILKKPDSTLIGSAKVNVALILSCWIVVLRKFLAKSAFSVNERWIFTQKIGY